MLRREFNSVCMPALLTLLGAAHGQALALSLADLSGGDASRGVKAALEQGAKVAIGLLGKTDGFLGNDKVRIPLPGYLNDASQLLRTFGMGQRLDELITAMNRAAESAVPLAQDLLLGAVKSMNVDDAKKILSGGDTSVTAFFTEKTRSPLAEKFLPIVTRSTEKVGLAASYNQIAGKAVDMGLMGKENASIQQYVTGKSLDGLYFMIGEQEKKIRQDPVGTGSALLSKVFGALK
jgi:Protein of unknown function (DUF4197)